MKPTQEDAMQFKITRVAHTRDVMFKHFGPIHTKTEPPVSAATLVQKEALRKGVPPSQTEPPAPLGATYVPDAFQEGPSKEHGPEFPLTPSARSHTVTDERMPARAVIDDGESPDEASPDDPK